MIFIKNKYFQINKYNKNKIIDFKIIYFIKNQIKIKINYYKT